MDASMRPCIHACPGPISIWWVPKSLPIWYNLRILVSFSDKVSGSETCETNVFPSFYPHSDGWGWCFCGRSFTTNHCKEAGQDSHFEHEMNKFRFRWMNSGLDIYCTYIYFVFLGVTGVQEYYGYYQSHPNIIQGWTSFWASTGNGISLIWAWFGPPEIKTAIRRREDWCFWH